MLWKSVSWFFAGSITTLIANEFNLYIMQRRIQDPVFVLHDSDYELLLWNVWTTKGVTPYFQSGTFSVTLYIANLLHARSRIWTSKDPKLRFCWTMFCSSDNNYTTTPLVFIIGFYFFISYLFNAELFLICSLILRILVRLLYISVVVMDRIVYINNVLLQIFIYRNFQSFHNIIKVKISAHFSMSVITLLSSGSVMLLFFCD